MELVQEDSMSDAVRHIKIRLILYRDRDREIENQIERLEVMENKMYSVRSPVFSDMPKASSVSGDRMIELIARKDELERKVKGLIERQDVERKWIQGMLERVRDADERAVIEMRYLDGESWRSISKMLFGRFPDYSEKEDSFLRRTTKLHGRALATIANHMIYDNISA